jgi:hypothetical protein
VRRAAAAQPRARAFRVGARLAEEALLVQRLPADAALGGVRLEALGRAQRLVLADDAPAILAARRVARAVLPLRAANDAAARRRDEGTHA